MVLLSDQPQQTVAHGTETDDKAFAPVAAFC